MIAEATGYSDFHLFFFSSRFVSIQVMYYTQGKTMLQHQFAEGIVKSSFKKLPRHQSKGPRN